MTSKISSGKLFKESIKRNFAMGALMMLVYFCIFPICGMAMLHEYSRVEWLQSDWIQGTMRNFLAFNTPLMAVTMIFAVIIGILQFSYLHSKEKLDFYHSFPVRREQLFVINYLSGIVQWAIPYAVNLFLVLCLASVKGCADGLLWIRSWQGMGIQLVAFLVIYSFMILAMMLTGKVFIAILGMGVACLYFPAVLFLQEGLHSIYFTTYLNQGDVAMDYMRLSPVYACFDLMGRFASIERSSRDMLLGLLLMAILVMGVSIYLYRLRGSESAGGTVAFTGIARVLKFLIVVPFSLLGNIIFYAIGGNVFWGFFGLVFGFVLSTAIVEFIYCMDIREVFSDKKQILLTFAVTFCILMFFQFDLSSFDKKLPARDQVESVEFDQCSVGYYGPLASMLGKYTLLTTKDGRIVYQVQDYIDKEDFPVKDLDKVYALLEKRLSRSEAAKSGNRTTIFVKYNMVDGTEKERRYSFEKDVLNEYFSEIWDDQDYKEYSIPLLKVDEERVLDITVGSEEYQGYVSEENVSLYVPSDTEEIAEEYVEEISAERLNGERMDLDKEQEKELFTVLCDELRKVSLQDLQNATEYNEESLPLLNVVYLGEDGEVYGDTFFLSDALPRTKALVKSWGYDFYEIEDFYP